MEFGKILIVLLIFSSAATAVGGTLSIYQIDVKQGDSALIVGPDGTTVLVDAGQYTYASDKILGLLNELGITELDYTIITHYDSDHINAYCTVINQVGAPAIAYDRGGDREASGASSPRPAVFVNYLACAGAARQTIAVDDTIDLGDGAIIYVLAVGDPDSTTMGVSSYTTLWNGIRLACANNENEKSVALAIQYGGFDMLLMGDLTGIENPSKSCSEDRLDVEGPVGLIYTGDPFYRHVDVYKADHHGSDETSNSPDFLTTILPEVVVISVGDATSCGAGFNTYGHPGQASLDRYDLVGVDKIYQTQQGGASYVSTPNPCTPEAGQTYPRDYQDVPHDFLYANHVRIIVDGSTYMIKSAAGPWDSYVVDDAPPCAGCLIGSACHGPGEINPENACLICDPDQFPNAWSNRNCNDGNLCTDDSCDPASGCRNTNNIAPCNDNDACTQGDTCGGGSCQAGSPLICNDGKVCTDDLCDPDTGCLFVNNTSACDDGDICTIDDTCADGTCAGTLEPAQYLELTNPASLELVPGGTTRNITWDYGLCPLGHYSSVRLSASIDGGASYPIVIEAAAPDTGSYAWTAPAINSGTVRIKIQVETAHDETADDFTVYMPRNLQTMASKATGDVILTWDGGPADVYALTGQFIDDPASWTLRAGNVTSPWTDTDAAGIDAIFYRLANHDGAYRAPGIVGKSTVHLVSGFNLVALPFMPEAGYTAQNLLDELNAGGEHASSLIGWDSGSQFWNLHFAAYPDYNDFELEAGSGYFLEITDPMDWIMAGRIEQEPFQTYLGYDYTLLGLPTGEWPSAQDILEAISNQGGSGYALYGWLAGTQEWNSHFAAFPAFNNFSIALNEGYFVRNDLPADLKFNPLRLEQSGVTHSGFTVSWSTALPTTGWVVYGAAPDALTNIAAENWSSLFVAQTAHTVGISGLEGGIIYYDLVISGAVYDNAGAHYQLTLPEKAFTFIESPKFSNNRVINL